MAPKCAPGPRGRGTAKGQAKAKAKAAVSWVVEGNRRKRQREAALRALNLLAEEVGVEPVPLKTAGRKVQKLMKKVEARCVDDAKAN